MCFYFLVNPCGSHAGSSAQRICIWQWCYLCIYLCIYLCMHQSTKENKEDLTKQTTFDSNQINTVAFLDG